MTSCAPVPFPLEPHIPHRALMEKDLLKYQTLYTRRTFELLGLKENFVYEEEQPCD